MNAIFVVGAVASVLVHMGFFAIESLLFTTAAGRKIFGITTAEAETMKFLAFNQGFYNLFLALGVVVGLVLMVYGDARGRAIVAFACACMVGAGCVLATGGKRVLRGVLAQALPPLVALVALLVGG